MIVSALKVPTSKPALPFQECMEYYGSRRGQEICKDYYDDFMECAAGRKQVGTNRMARTSGHPVGPMKKFLTE